MATIYYDGDADPRAIAGQTIAIIGYGNQGGAQAQNLRDSGLDVIVGNIDDTYRKTALTDGFSVLPIAEATARADVVFLLTPDEVMPDVYAREIAPHLRPGSDLDFAHGYTVRIALLT